MGGQACVFYGGAEFSRDTDLAILADAANLVRLKKALVELQAELIAIPTLELKYLRRGHAVHFRCHHPDAAGMRVDIMSKMRGVGGFASLWRRRTSLELPNGQVANLMALPDLVLAKKTQRDKDWPMIRRLVEAHYFEHHAKPSAVQVRFWFLELRTPELLLNLARSHGTRARSLASRRGLLRHAVSGSADALRTGLRAEEDAERELDRRYWEPLRRELEKLRRERTLNPRT